MVSIAERTSSTLPWAEANQRYLVQTLAIVRGALERHLARGRHDAPPADETPAPWTLAAPPALERLCALFRLSPFERDLLLLCAGVELDARFPALCTQAHGDPQRGYVTFSLALAALPGAHWSALGPGAPLRRWQLLGVGSGAAMTLSPLRIDERILHALTGVAQPDERLAGLISPVAAATTLSPSQHAVAGQIAAALRQATGRTTLPAMQLYGADRAARRQVAAAACAALGLRLCAIRTELLPTLPGDLTRLARLLEREALLSDSALLLDFSVLEGGESARVAAASWLVEHLGSMVLASARERRTLVERASMSFEVERPRAEEQRALWRGALGPAAASLNGTLEQLVAQFDLNSEAIQAAGEAAQAALASDPQSTGCDLYAALWDICRHQARPRLDDLAQRIDSAVGWDDLVLPERQRQQLEEIAAHVRRRATVYGAWGFAAQGPRGLGISALFAGPSGTGKTMAAEVLANALRLDLYRIDLSQVVSKYIGETEKNLRRIFDAAEAGGAILLFDEADALFGKRSEVKDSHDRHANIEVSYLLQRIESYRGLAILTTNLKHALDQAFLRRIRFVVQFPFPDSAQRAAIWRRAFPPATPTEDLDSVKLARLNIAGGNIRSIALNAAFLAADADAPVGMGHLLRAARGEYAKLEKTLTEAEVGDWGGMKDEG